MKLINRLFSGIGIFSVLAYIAVLLAGVYGYVNNIVIIANNLNSGLNTMILVRVIGVFAFPLGAIVGWF